MVAEVVRMIVDITITVLSTLASIAVGGLITWRVSKCYYEQASEELREEADELQRMNELILRSIEEGIQVKLNRNEEGKITGIQLGGAAHIEGGSSVQAAPDNTGGSD